MLLAGKIIPRHSSLLSFLAVSAQDFTLIWESWFHLFQRCRSRVHWQITGMGFYKWLFFKHTCLALILYGTVLNTLQILSIFSFTTNLPNRHWEYYYPQIMCDKLGCFSNCSPFLWCTVWSCPLVTSTLGGGAWQQQPRCQKCRYLTFPMPLILNLISPGDSYDGQIEDHWFSQFSHF